MSRGDRPYLPALLLAALCGCNGADEPPAPPGGAGAAVNAADHDHDHDHDHAHDDHDHDHDHAHDHDHGDAFPDDLEPPDLSPPGSEHVLHSDERLIGDAPIARMDMYGVQALGPVRPGEPARLWVFLSRDDGGRTMVRAWIGTNRRADFDVVLGRYDAERGGHVIDTVAPDPLPPMAQWFVELQRPDGTRHTGIFPTLR